MPWTIDIPEPTRIPSDRLLTQDHGGLAELSEVYRQLGFEAGYTQAARDMLESSVVTAEQILREQNASLIDPKAARRLLYAFIARVDRRLSLFVDPTPIESKENATAPCTEGYVEGGMGI